MPNYKLPTLTHALVKHPWLAEAAVFLLFLIVYLPLQQSNVFADPDSFYHLKMAELIAAHGPVRSFGWLPFTTLAQNFADHHFLYHVALIPFIKAFGSFHGMQIATATFAALAVAVFSWALRRLNVKYAPIFALMLGIVSPFVFRMNLAKASSFGVILLIVGIILALERRALPLAIVSFLYVWTHGSWPALLVCGSIVIFFSQRVAARERNDRAPRGLSEAASVPLPFAEEGTRTVPRGQPSSAASTIVALLGGAAVGLVLNPFFPQNLKFYWEQIVQIAVVGYRDTIGVGGEWYPYDVPAFFSDLPFLWLLLAIATLACAYRYANEEKADRRGIALLVIGALFAFMTLRSRRHIEYFVPLALLAAAYWIDRAREAIFRDRDISNFTRAPFIILSLGVVAMITGFARAEVVSAENDLATGYRFTLYRDAAAYLEKNAEPDEVVIHADWDDFPPLFYWDDAQRYMMGLDPTFFYRANPDQYRRYVDFTLGKDEDPAATVAAFGARYVFMDHDHQALVDSLERSERFTRVYEDEESYIYQLK